MLVRCVFLRYGAKDIEVNIVRQFLQSGKGRFMQWICVGCLCWDLTVFTQIMRIGPSQPTLTESARINWGQLILRLSAPIFSMVVGIREVSTGKCLLMK